MDRPDFAAKLAAGTLPTVFPVPFTDARTLGQTGQLANLTPYVKALPYFKEVQPGGDRRRHRPRRASRRPPEGRVRAGAALQPAALHAGRARSEQAADHLGEVAADAKQITQKTGKAGYAEMGKDDNTAGWILTTVVYSLGGRMETGIGTSRRPRSTTRRPSRRSTC